MQPEAMADKQMALNLHITRDMRKNPTNPPRTSVRVLASTSFHTSPATYLLYICLCICIKHVKIVYKKERKKNPGGSIIIFLQILAEHIMKILSSKIFLHGRAQLDY